MPAQRCRGFVRSGALAALVVVTLAGSFAAGTSPARPPDADVPPLRCGTSVVGQLLGIRPTVAAAIADGEPLGFDQDPPLVFANHTGPIALRSFEVVGDFSEVHFRRFDPDSPDGQPETWQRVNSRTVDGRVISAFEPEWSDVTLANALSRQRFGFDSPQLYWGDFEVPGTATRRPIYLRMGLASVPASEVVRVNDRVQYASNVVNLVIPSFGDARVTGGAQAFELSAASRMFFQYFADAYDVLAIVPERLPVADYFGFHQNVRNAVLGLNIPVFDQSSFFGSAGVLQGIELYTGAQAARFESVDHEMAHQWGSNFDWTRISGVTRAGGQPSSHAPLWTGGETLLGAVLNPDRRVRTLQETYEIERTPAPVRYHPIERYSMGTLAGGQVPEFRVFVDQAQFDPDHATSPAVGAPVTGETRLVSMADIVREHGPRIGPVPTQWRRATVLVSRDRLATQRVMDYWNFFAQRLADRNREVRPTIEGYVPFRAAASDAVTLTTAIKPLNRDGLAETLDIDSPAFGATDWRGVEFSSPIPTRFVAGGPVTLAGEVRASDPVDFDRILIAFFRPDVADPVQFYGVVRRTREFSVTVQFAEGQEGRYYVGVFLFWPGSGPQYARTYLSSVSVEGTRAFRLPRDR